MRFLESVPYLRVRDMERSLRFYHEGLGFKVTRQLNDTGGPFWARLEKDGTRTTLGAAAPGRTVNIEVDVLAKYVEKLSAR